MKKLASLIIAMILILTTAVAAGEETVIYSESKQVFGNTAADTYPVYYHPSDTAAATGFDTFTRGVATQFKDIAELGDAYAESGKAFLYWTVFRGERNNGEALVTGGTTPWAALENGALPAGCSYDVKKNKGSITDPFADNTNWREVHVYAQWSDGFTVCYFENENAAPSNTTTFVSYGIPTATKTTGELGFNPEGKIFYGWKIYRPDTDSWLVHNPANYDDIIWKTTGELTDSTEFYLIENGKALSTTLKEGTLNLYAQWISTTIDVTNQGDGGLNANGNDTEDDHWPIQRALEKAKTTNDVLTVYIPDGTYYLDSVLVIYSNTRLLLSGGARIVLRTPDMMLTNSDGNGNKSGGYGRSQNITIQGGTWDGNGSAGNKVINMIYIAHASNVTISGVTMQNGCGNHFIEFAGVKDGRVTGSTFQNFYLDNNTSYAALKGGTEEETFEKSGETSVTSEAIQLDYASAATSASATPYDLTACTNITVSGCTFSNCLSGVGNHHDDARSSNITISNNTFSTMKNTCVNLCNVSSATVQNNQATNVRKFAFIYASNGTINMAGNTATAITGNSTATAAIGIDVKDSSGATVSGNSLSGFINGIQARNSTATAKENTVKDSSGDGIYFEQATNGSIEGNTVENSGGNSIAADTCTSTAILTNTVKEAAKSAIALTGCETVPVSGNQISDVQKYGVVATSCKGTDITGNTVARTGLDGINAGGVNGNITGNAITESGEYNIRTYKQGNTSCSGSLEGNQYDLGYGIANFGGMAAGANVYAPDGVPQGEPDGFTIIYHLKDGAAASETTTHVVYGTATRSLSAHELGFSVAGMRFNGWIGSRNDPHTRWCVPDANGKESWTDDKPAEANAYKFKEGIKFSKTIEKGSELHLYGTWVSTGNTKLEVLDAQVQYPVLKKGTSQHFTVTTEANAKYLMLSDTDTVFMNWKADKYSELVGSERIWNVDFTISSAGDRVLNFRTGTEENKPVSNRVFVFFSAIETGVAGVEVKDPWIGKGGTQTFTVTTTSDAKYLMLYAENGTTKVQTWTASNSNSTVEGDLRIWTVTYSMGGTGNRKLILKAGTTTTPTGATATAAFTVGEKAIFSAEGKYAQIVRGSAEEFTVITSADVETLTMYAEDGATKVTSWAAGKSSKTGANKLRTWTVSYSIKNPGSRRLVFKGTTGKGAVTNAMTVPFEVISGGVMDATVADEFIGKGGTQTFTAKTHKDDKYLMLYSENGTSLVKEWAADSKNSTVSGSVRTWKVTQSIGSTGNRKLVLKAGSASKKPAGATQTVAFTVAEKRLFSAEGAYATIAKGSAEEFTVVTSADVQNLMLYAEDGKTVVTKWTAAKNSTAGANKVRTWKVSQKISSTGNRKLIFKGGTTNTTPVTNSITVPFTVVSTGVMEAKIQDEFLGKGGTQTFTVTTTTDAKTLFLYAEDGKTKVNSWSADSYSSVSGSIRTWTVTQSIGGAGNRVLTLKAGTGSTPTEAGRKVAFTVSGEAKKILSATAKYDVIAKGAAEEFTVITSTDVENLMLYAEDGKTLVNKWTASGNSTTGNNKLRTWTVSQTISSTGSRKLVFKGGTTNTTPVTNAYTVPFTVEATGVISASPKNASISKGTKQDFTVKTTSDAKYLMLYAENGSLLQTWDADSASSVSGSVRTWEVSYKIGSAGKRNLVFKAGTTKTPTKSGRIASFEVK